MYPETLLLKIIGELFVENRIMRENLEVLQGLQGVANINNEELGETITEGGGKHDR